MIILKLNLLYYLKRKILASEHLNRILFKSIKCDYVETKSINVGSNVDYE